jgi:transcriptional regulator with XRE-family HTH domain
MINDVIVPAQIRAARAYLNWSQEDLAKTAGVGLSTVRDAESEKRATDTDTVELIRLALDNEGIQFVPGGTDGGPGVRMVAYRPNILRRPTTMQKWEGMPFTVEHNGKAITVFVISDVLDDLDGLHGTPAESVYLQTFEKHRGKILDAVELAIHEPTNFDNYGRLYIRQKDIYAVTGTWFKVTTTDAINERDAEAAALMNKFLTQFLERFRATKELPAVSVWRDRNAAETHVYFFSPLARSIAGHLLQQFDAEPCAKPDLMKLVRIPL